MTTLNLQDYQDYLSYFNDYFNWAEEEVLKEWNLEREEMNVDHPDRDKFNDEVHDKTREALREIFDKIINNNECEYEGRIFYKYSEEQLEEIKHLLGI